MSTPNVDQIAERMLAEAVRQAEAERIQKKQEREFQVEKMVGDIQVCVDVWMECEHSLPEKTWMCKTFVDKSVQLEAARQVCAQYKGEKYHLTFLQTGSNCGNDVFVFRFDLN